MHQNIKLKYYNPVLKIALQNWREVYLMDGQPKKLNPEVFRGKLVYRIKGSSRLYSYDQIEHGLVKRTTLIKEQIPSWLSI